MKNKFLPFLLSLTLFFFHLADFAQAPDLRTASDYVLFTTTGAVSNTANTHLTGNVGTNSGAVSGFGNVNGVMHNQDAATAQAATDLLAGYNAIIGTPANFFPSVLLGNGDTFIAGVYSIGANATLDNTLTLDGRNDPNAVFIIKITGTLGTATNSQIKLINGAVACNVFWAVEGLVSLGTGTSMKGTVIANNAAIDLGVNVSLEGRALSTTGAITTNAVQANLPLGCSSAVLNGPAAPSLASAACYAIFTSSGTVINTGPTTTVTGDIGSNSLTTSGYNQALVTGKVHLIPDASTATCAVDLQNVYNYLNTLPYDIQLLYPADFGLGLVLTPHTYYLNGATTLTDTVFLNAQDNPDAVFVLQISGAFATSTFATVALMNGAKAANVFWKITGAVDLSSSVDFKGTIVNDGAVNLATGVTLNGRALSILGNVSTAEIRAAISSPCTTLPVSWLFFRGNTVQKTVLLEWSTASETDNGFFTIEKSSDGQRFVPLATVNASGQTGHTASNYTYTDQQPFSMAYYRISQTDLDGNKKYFRTIQVRSDLNVGIHTLYHVQNNYIYVQISEAAPGTGTIDVYSIDGIKITSQKITLGRDISTYKIARQLQKGVYVLHIESQGVKLFTTKVVVQ